MTIVKVVIENVCSMNLGGDYRSWRHQQIKPPLLQSSDCTQLRLQLGESKLPCLQLHPGLVIKI
ncbi:hypothetical protein D3C76_1012350 [compost metagenome]